MATPGGAKPEKFSGILCWGGSTYEGELRKMKQQFSV